MVGVVGSSPIATTKFILSPETTRNGLWRGIPRRPLVMVVGTEQAVLGRDRH